MYPCRFGPYVLLQPLGEGGMGRVALALGVQSGQERLCVVKRLHARFLKDPQHRKRFDDEAAISRRLSHPNLIDTFAAGEVDGEPFIAQAFVDGRDLSEFVGRTRSQKMEVPGGLWIYIVHQLTQGLAYAHDFENLGLVHRDINPPNIRLSFSGEVKLLDFGLAKWKDKSSQTVQGSLVGKTAYISPEQLKSEPPDRRSDLYVLGVVLWEVLAGHPFGTVLVDGRPAYAEGERAALARLFSPVVQAPSLFVPSVNDALDKVVLKSVAPDPAERFQTAAEMGAALAEFVPTDYAPAAKLAELMHLGFASEMERKSREATIEAGRALLRVEGASAAQQADGVSASAAREPLAGPQFRRWKWVVLAFLAALAVGITVWVKVQRAASPAPTRATPRPEPRVAAPLAQSPSPPIPGRGEGTAAIPRARQSQPVRVSAEHAEPRTSAQTQPSGETQASLVQQAKEAFSAGELDRATRMAREALVRGANADAWIVIGNVSFKRRAYGEAARAYQEALRLRPDDERILRRRDMALKLEANSGSSP